MSNTENDSARDGGEVTRGPNGFPYADNDGTGVNKHPGGDYELKVERTDGERLTASLRETQLKALEKSIQRLRGEQDE